MKKTDFLIALILAIAFVGLLVLTDDNAPEECDKLKGYTCTYYEINTYRRNK